MTRVAIALTIILFGIVAILATLDSDRAGSAKAAGVAAPPGLSAYGRRIWNLEALLRDTIGRRDVYFEWINSRRGPVNFTTRFTANCCSSYFLFTFASPHGSAFQRVARRRALPPAIGGSGGEVPITVKGQYVYCGAGRWLYYHYGNGPANFQIDCKKP